MRFKNSTLLKILGFLLAVIVSTKAHLPLNPGPELNNLKTAFVYNFTKYIAWPQIEKDQTFIIGVLGDDEIISSFQQMAEKKLVGKLPIQIKHYKSLRELKYCHILYIAESKNTQLEAILKQIANRRTLTIASTTGFCKRGVMINFFIQDDMVKFEMNPAKLENAGLKASSQLLKLARIIE
ncbi:MAG: YfiR family protein [Candidatus Marinimicrobia bacterium]|nr:YfiR family protein [Candidatus Neomarinimicrobiota bacterium]